MLLEVHFPMEKNIVLVAFESTYIYSKITLRTCLQFVLMEFTTPDADLDTNEVHLGDADLVLSPPYDFLVLSVEEIFDLFVNDKKNHMGNCARFVLTRLPSTLKVMKDCPPSDSNWCARLGKTVAKRKGDIAVQKVAWMEMGSWGGDDLLSRIRNLCNEFFCSRARKAQQLLLKKAQESATEGAVELAVSDNFAARVIHCAIEEGTKDLLNCIFECESSRLALDDKRLRVNELWEKLANDFFNQASWNLELFDRERKGEAGVDFINPYNFVQSTTETFSGTDVRTAFNKLKSMYTVVHTNFHASGRNEGDGLDFEEGIESDDLFYENFAKTSYPLHARVLLYAHLLWGKAPPSFCLRTQIPGNQSQIGVKGTNITPNMGGTTASTPGKGTKDAMLQNFAQTLITGFTPKPSTEDEILAREATRQSTDRDLQIAKYYASKAQQTEFEIAAAKPKFHVSMFDSVKRFLMFAGFADAEAECLSQRFYDKGYRSVMSLKFAPAQTFEAVGMLEGQLNTVLGVLEATAWGPTAGF